MTTLKNHLELIKTAAAQAIEMGLPIRHLIQHRQMIADKAKSKTSGHRCDPNDAEVVPFFNKENGARGHVHRCQICGLEIEVETNESKQLNQ